MVLFTSRRQKGLAALSHDWYNKSDLAPWEGIKLKRLIRIGAVLAFLAVGAAVLLYLNAFTQSGENFRYLDWISASVVSADGGVALNRVYDLGVNSSRTFTTQYASFIGTVTDIQIPEAETAQ